MDCRIDLRKRSEQPEWMDTNTGPLETMEKTLGFLEVTNKYLGGFRAIRKYFNRWATRWPPQTSISILDIGTGSADIPRALTHWAEQKGHLLHITGIDSTASVIAIARQRTQGHPNIEIRHQDFFALPSEAPAYDYVIANLVFHHVASHHLIPFLVRADHLARRGVLILDLHRSPASYRAVQGLSHLLGNAIVRHDGPLSVRRSFQIQELEALAKEAQCPHLKASKELFFRVSLQGEKA